MGLLDTSDEDVKNHNLYKECESASKGLKETLDRFKKGGGTDGLVQPLAQAARRLVAGADKLHKQFPHFKGSETFRHEGIEVAKALIEKYPKNPNLDSTNLRKAVEDSNFRYA